MKILFTGGGTGGHIYPAAAVIRELRNKYGAGIKLSYLGPKDNFCKVVLSKEGVKVHTILSGKIRRYSDILTVMQNVIDAVIKVPIGIVQSFFWLFFTNPDLVFSKGGYGSFPVVISASILGIPIFLQESDSVPGLASQKTAKYAAGIFVAFLKTEIFPPQKMIVTGNPLRKELLAGVKEEAVKAFAIKGGRPLVLIMGGSQGAQRINDKILDSLVELLNNYEIIHLTGPRNIDQVIRESKITAGVDALSYYHPVGFADERTLANFYAIADLIISRAGAGSIFEISAVKKPSILIPLPEAAQNHQVKNAYAYAETGAALVMEENNFTSHLFLEKLRDMLSSPETMSAMSEAAAQFARPNAGQMIADYIVKYLNR
jgi:UDP-N-acetylglucosamine--N-acetylmuramyl-(pentapeptide) pyrophosphoryl-undecaprenol N-acetylglucosamine transferase